MSVVFRITHAHDDMAWLGVVQRRELFHSSPARGFDHALAETAVQIAHEFGIRLRELAERAVQELDTGPTLVLAVGQSDG